MKIEITGDESPQVLNAVRELIGALIDDLTPGASVPKSWSHQSDDTLADLTPEIPVPKTVRSLFDDSKDGPAEGASAVGSAPQTTPLTDSPAGAPLDKHGVPFNSAYCAQAKEPFYAAGNPREGQWKKRKGVSDSDYDAWYASARPAASATPAPAPEMSTAAAFSPAPVEAAPVTGPQDAQSFMLWCAEKQAAGLLTQDLITQAYKALAVDRMGIFPPTDPGTAAHRVGQLYDYLAQAAGA